MKITTNPTTVPAVTNVVVTYTVEAGDPAEFFFEVVAVDNVIRFDVDSRQSFSRSGTFITVPGDEGPHLIEAYNSTAVVGETRPFSVSPTYTVLPPSSPVTPTSTTILKSPTSTSLPTVATQPTSTPRTPDPTPSTQNTVPQKTPNVPSPPSLSGSSIAPVSGIRNTTQSSFTVWSNSTVASTSTVVVETALSSTSASNIPSAAKSNPPNTDIIIGAAVAGAVVVGIIAFFAVRRYKNRQKARSESVVANALPTIDPFLAFSWRPATNEKHRAAFQDGWGDSGRSSFSQSVSRSYDRTASESSQSLPMGSSGGESRTHGPQMEWVLRLTNDPPPGYNVSA
ncbi:hypothetical protein B0H17DRAFT_1327752 [Mycena rosella]|uniref:Uncharacterized protein n=1 Tax=Mycena rosella TaxID=1033263 RepID=A0AAD7GM81_MYCRO|nr:hypothetical protein B0H17DRAFT_1327752 [Mycena rosella]